MVENPFLAECERGGVLQPEECESLCRRYSWALPSQEMLDLIAKYQPIIEMGAGTGYWAWLLRQMGVQIRACDLYPPSSGKNEFVDNIEYVPIEAGGPELLEGTGHTLLLCMPLDQLTFELVNSHRGEYVIHISDQVIWAAPDNLIQLFHMEFDEVERLETTQFSFRSFLTVRRRRPPDAAKKEPLVLLERLT